MQFIYISYNSDHHVTRFLLPPYDNIKKITLFLFKDEKKQKSSSGQGLCCAPVTDRLFIKGLNKNIALPFIFVINFVRCDLRLRPRLGSLRNIFESLVST